MKTNLFKGTFRFTKLLFRQEKIKTFIWILCLVLVTIAAASSYPTVYKTFEEQMAFGMTMKNPAMIAMIGPGYALENYNLGAIFANEMLLFTAITVAVMNIFLVGGATRNDEENGILEMVRSLPVGKLSYLSASMIVTFVINLLLSIVISIGLLVTGIDDITVNGAFLYGFILGSTGFIFGAITAFSSQLSETSRGTIGLSFGLLLTFYMIRAIGDVSVDFISYLSPLGWVVRTDVFVTNMWWPVILMFTFSIIFISLAFYLNMIRDIGTGFLPTLKGKAHASKFLKSPFGLIVRLQKTSLIAWSIGLFLLGASFGAILGELETFFSENDLIKEILPKGDGTLIEQFISMIIMIFSFMTIIPGMMSLLRINSEEKKNRTEYFYSNVVSRNKLLGNYYIIALIETIFMQLLVALGIWVIGTNIVEGGLSLSTILSSSFAYFPAFLVIFSLVCLCIGIYPKASIAVWLYYAFSFVLAYLANLLNLPEWVRKISVYAHIPQIPLEDFKLLPSIILIVISIILTFIGFYGYNKRDIQG